MAQQYNFRQNSCETDNSCLLPPPEFSCTETCTPCDNPCEQKCPPKVRVHQAITLMLNEYERCFSLYSQVSGGEPIKIPAFITSVLMRVRRQGFCRVLTEECPIRSGIGGDVCFLWSDKFRKLPDGYYEADFYINDKLRFTLLFRKTEQWTVQQAEVQTDLLPCAAPPHCVGCVPMPDVDTQQPLGDCDADKC